MAESSKKRPLNPGSAIVESLKKEHYDEELGSITIHARSVKDILRLVADRFGQIPQRNEQQHLDHFKNAVEASGSTMVATCVLACETLDFEPVANYRTCCMMSIFLKAMADDVFQFGKDLLHPRAPNPIKNPMSSPTVSL